MKHTNQPGLMVNQEPIAFTAFRLQQTGHLTSSWIRTNILGFSDPMILPLNYRCFRGIELYFLAPGQVLDLWSSDWLNAKMLDQIEISGHVR